MEKTILLLEKRDCDFWKDDEIKKISDLGNYFFFAMGWAPKKGAKGNYILEISRSYRHEKEKDTYKMVHGHALRIATEYYNESDYWNDSSLEKLFRDLIQEKDLKYTLNDLIEILNTFGKYKIQKVVIDSDCYNVLLNLGGTREVTILQNCIRTTEILQNAEHHVIRFYDKEKNCFDYDLVSKKIIG